MMMRDLEPAMVECYQVARQLKEADTATTEDGWIVSYQGERNIPHSQYTVARKGEQEITLSHYWGSEGIARLLTKARAETSAT